MNVTEITTMAEKTEKVLRLAPYCRVSSNSDDQLHSFAAQIKYYKDYERKNPQYKLVDIYADEGITGTSMKNRDEFNRLIRDCKRGKIDRVIVKSVSRFARNTQELLMVLRTLKEIGVSVYFEEQGIDTDKMNMEMIVTFPGMAAQQESETISGNMRWSYKKRMESGEFNCCSPAYGFRLIDGSLTIDESEAAVIRRIFNLYLQGIGMQSIANILNKEGVPRGSGQSKWYGTTIKYILNNERYMGDALLQKKYTTDTLPFRQKRNHGEYPQYYVENSNPPIVSREIYQAAQKLQKERTQEKRGSRERYPLTKMLRCACCGRTFRRQTASGIAYWICTGRASGTTDCKNGRVRENDVYEAFTNMVWKLKSNLSNLLGTLIHQMETMQSRYSQSQEIIRQIDKKIADLSAQNLVVARLHTKGILNAAEYSAQAGELNGKISALRKERRRVLAEDENDQLLDTLKTLGDIFDDYEPQIDFDEEMFEQIVETVLVEDGFRITFKLVGGIELTEILDEKGRCKPA